MMTHKKTSLRVASGAAALEALMTLGQAQAATQFTAYHGGSMLSAVTGTPSATPVPLADLVVNAAGIASFDGQDAPGNTVLTLSALPNSTVNMLTYNLSIATIGTSWLSDAAVLFTNSAGDGVMLTAGFNDDMPGTGTYTGSALLTDLGLSFQVGADGRLFVQFFETFDDVAGAADATYTAGNITFGSIGAVPEPSTYGLMALGLFGVVGAARRKARQAA